MKKHFSVLKITSVLLFIIYTNSLFVPTMVLGQEGDCFDKTNPTLESARKSFLALNYQCAEEELDALLKMETLSTEQRADAHVLLAEVYYARVRDNSEKRSKVISQFVAAFEAYREWKGELNIKSPEFMAMMKEAQVMVDEEEESKEAAAAEEKPAEFEPVPTTTIKPETTKKPWYTKWWAIGLGVGLVAGIVIIAAGGGGDDGGGGTGSNDLPDFPDPPTTGK
jgi:hypothetical protein